MSRPAKIALWVVGILVFVFLVVPFVSIFFGGPWLFTGFIHLLTGWVPHGTRVLPKVTVNGSGVGMLALCLVLAAFVGHRFCRWLWQGTGHPEPWRLKWTVSGLAMIVLMFGAGMAITAVAHQTGWLLRSKEPLLTGGGNERNASTSLKTIAVAQADFRSNDRDGNQVNDFWRGDIAGLYAVKAPEGHAIKLIELSIAAADDRPITDIRSFAEKQSKAGYWYRALRYPDEAAKVDAGTRFAACAYPDTVGAGIYLFLVTEAGTLYRKPFEGKVPEVCPEDPLKDGWTKLD